jgi:hypothetical protein
MRRNFLAAMAAVTVLGLFGATGARADTVEVAGIKFETVETVGNQKLQLNGAGIRYKAIFKVYAAGLYLQTKANTPEAILADKGPKRLHIVALRDLDGNDLGKLFTKGVENNASREEFIKAINGMLKISELFANKKELKKNESFTVDFIPGTGTVVSVNGVVQGDPIKEPEFYGAFLHIWLGKNPPDSQLKEKLLGGGQK